MGEPLSPGGKPAPCAGQLAPPACVQEASVLLHPQRCQSCDAGSLQQEPWHTYFPSKRERGEFLFCAPRDISFYRMMSLDFQSVGREMPFYRLSLHPAPTLLDLLHIFRGNLSPLCPKADQSLVFFIPKPEQAVCFPLVFHPTHCAHSSICPISELRTLWKL